MQTIILASKSPRRKELMRLIPIQFEVITQEIEEVMDDQKTPEENVSMLAEQKALAVAKVYQDRWVIGCDTVVIDKGQILGKPKDTADAFKMLENLQGKCHAVCTGVSIVNRAQNIRRSFTTTSWVYMRSLESKEIAWYVSTGEPMDKAGAYGIQGYASNFVEKIEGDYFNIVGLPVSRLYKILKEYHLISF